MSHPIDLSITGKPSPRVEHPRSANRTQTPLNINRANSLHSNIFGTNQNQITKKAKSRVTRNEDEDEKNVIKAGVITRKQNDKEATKKEYATYETARMPAPKGVPQLSLDEIIGKDDMTFTKAAEKDSTNTPDTISWGTPIKLKSNANNTKGGGWKVAQYRPVKILTTSHKHGDVPYLDLKLSQSSEELGQLREVVKQIDEDINFEYFGKGNHEELDNLKKQSRNKKIELIEEAILADQLSNLQMGGDTTSQTACSPFGINQKFDTKSKRHNDLYSSSATNIGNSGDISNRLHFGARILSLNGHDARREISGFFIISDNTITMYEFRQFGTRSKALPFIQRGVYPHITGHRKGETYRLLDVGIGKNLSFETDCQSSLPASLKKKRMVTFKVTDVDEDNKQKLLFNKCKTANDKREVEDLIKGYFVQENNAEREFLLSVQSSIKNYLKSHGGKTMIKLYRHFKQLDKGDGLLGCKEYKEVLAKFHITIEDEIFVKVWNIVDCNDDGKLDYGEFTRGFFGEMLEQRKLYVRKAFSRLDPSKTGVGQLNDIRKYFCASKHPSVVKGEIAEAVLLDELIQNFRWSRHKSDISFSEFEAYYEGVSMGMESDQSFVNLLRHTWSI